MKIIKLKDIITYPVKLLKKLGWKLSYRYYKQRDLKIYPAFKANPTPVVIDEPIYAIADDGAGQKLYMKESHRKHVKAVMQASDVWAKENPYSTRAYTIGDDLPTNN